MQRKIIFTPTRILGILMWGLMLAPPLVEVASGQSANIRGTVRSQEDGMPLQGVNVALFQDEALVTGTATDADGLFALASLEPGRYVLRVSFTGFLTQQDTLSVRAGDRLILSFSLEESEEELGEITVEDEREAGAGRVVAGQTTLKPADIELIPSPDVSADLVNYLTTLPGVVSPGDRGGQLFIRGGEPWQNQVLLDGMDVYQPFHILGFFSSFPADILSQVDIYAGGYTSEYGGRISSVIDVKSRNGDKRRYKGSLSAAAFVSGFTLEGPIYDDYASFLVSYRESVVDQFAARVVDDDLPFRFGDLFAKGHVFVSSNSQLSLSLLRTHDKGAVFEGNDLEPEEVVEWTNRSAGLRYLVFPRAFPVMMELIISGTRLRTSVGAEDLGDRNSRLASLNSSVNITHFKRRGEVKWGLFARTLEMESELGGEFQGLNFRREYTTEVGAYLEPELQLDNGWNVRAGFRVHSFPSKFISFLEPRIRAIKRTERSEISAAFGIFHQEVVGLTDRRDAAGVFTAWSSSPAFSGIPEAIHLITGYRRTLSRSLDASLELYAKKLNNLFIPEWTAFPRFTTQLQQADGRVLGADLRLEYRKSPVHVLITYGLSSVRYTAQQDELELWYGTNELDFRPAHDRRHQLNAVLGLDLRVVDLNVRWQFGSGLPFSRALGFDGFILMDRGVDVFVNPGTRRVIYERPYNGILPTYHRLDVTLEKTWEFPYDVRLTAVGGVINAYDRNNIFYLDVFTLRRVDQLPLVPTFGLRLEFE